MPAPKRILITGAAGFLAKHLTERLARAGHSVFALMRSQPPAVDAALFKQQNVEVILQDLEKLNPAALPAQIDVLMTLAQSSHFRDFPQKAEEIFAVNVTANLQLLQWAIANRVRHVVHASSGGIYGGKSGGEFFEKDRFAIDSPVGFYLGSKLCSEVVFQNYMHFFETAVTLRPFFIYGPRQRSDKFIARLIESVRKGEAISLQGQNGLRVNPIYIGDAVAAFANAIELSGTHVINVAGPQTLSLREIGDMIGAALGIAPKFETRPGEPVDYVADIQLMRSKLGAPATSFADGIRAAVGAQI